MSRSFKKVPASTSSGSGYRKWAKRAANKKVRRTVEVPNGKGYKKLFCSYEIDDWKWICFSPKDFDYLYREKTRFFYEEGRYIIESYYYSKEEIEREIYRTMNK